VISGKKGVFLGLKIAERLMVVYAKTKWAKRNPKQLNAWG
jgi:hypothetical protein